LNEWYDAEKHVERAHELYEAGRWEEAETELRQAISLNPFQPEWQFNLGLTLDAAGRHPEAAQVFKEAFELEPEDSQSALMAGLSLLRAERPGEALEWFDKAEKAEPGTVAPYVHRIEAHTDLGQHEQAEVNFYLAQQIDPKAADAYMAMADSLIERELFEKAVWCLREAARIQPELPGVQGRLADVYAATGRLERARQLYLRELRQDPGDLETLLALGRLLVDMHRFGEAGEKFRRILEIEPDNADAHFELGVLAERQGNDSEALMQFDVVTRLEADYPAARRRLAALLHRRGKADDRAAVESLLRRELASFRNDPEALEDEDFEDLGHLLLDTNLPREAVRVLTRLVDRRPDQAGYRHLLSVAHFQAGDRRAGMVESRRVLRLDPRHVAAMHNMAMACIQDRRWARARYWLSQVRRIDPDDSSLRRLSLALKLHAVAEVFGGAAGLLARRLYTRRRPPLPEAQRRSGA
jgi:tetratricopeptide (TPR) repeat protein